MKELKVINIDYNESILYFDNGIKLQTEDSSDAYGLHFWSLEDLTLEDFKDLTFNLSNDDFLKRLEDYGIELIANNGVKISIPCYAIKNGSYSTNLALILLNNENKIINKYDISYCQFWI